MPIPPYMWLKDDGGADIKGSVDVQDREGSIEIIGLSHGVNLPVDSANGKVTGTRQHSSMMIEKKWIVRPHTFTRPPQRGRRYKVQKSSFTISTTQGRKWPIILYLWSRSE